MKIVNLKAENFKRLKAIDITPTDSTVILAGANEQGKSSILDAIWAALAGGAATRNMPEPVRSGEQKATVELDLGDIKVSRSWTAGGASSITVTNPEGLKYSSPQAVLDKLVGKLTFDPLAFARMEPREQRATLLSLVELPFDLADHDAKRQKLLADIAASKNNVKIRTADLEKIQPVPDGTPDAEIPVADLMEKLREVQSAAQAHRAKLNDQSMSEQQLEWKRQEIPQREAQICEIENQILTLNQKLASAKDALATFRESIQKRTVELASARSALDSKAPVDATEIETQIKDADAANQTIRRKASMRAANDALGVEQQKLAAANGALAMHDEVKRRALNDAVFPVAGLAFSDDGITFNGIPFTQCSESQRIMISTAMGMAMNSTLKVMFIRDGSALDSTRMDMLRKMADERDYQIWIERVDESGKVGFVIEDGQIAM